MTISLVAAVGCNRSNPTVPTPVVVPNGEVGLPTEPEPDFDLGETFTVDDWTIQMPPGYTLQSQGQLRGTSTATWVAYTEGPPVNRSLFGLTIYNAPDDKSTPTAEQLRKPPGPETGLIDYRESPLAPIQIDGRTFERVTTSCSHSKSGKALRGFQYVYVGKPCIVMIYTGATEDEETYLEAKAAARTLRMR